MEIDGAFDRETYEAIRKTDSYEEYLEMAPEIRARNTESQIRDENWIKEVKAKVLDLSTTNDEIFDLAEYAMKSTRLMQILQVAMNMRQQITEMITNLMKSMHDSARAIITNLRS